MKSKLTYVLLLFTVLQFSCSKDDSTGPQGGNEGDIPTSLESGLFILNEGNFNTNNGSLTYLNLLNGKLSNKVFSAVNEGEILGDVVQSMTVTNDRFYIVVNNSKKIEVTDRELTSIGTIDGLLSPRYLEIINNDKAYLSNLVFGGSTGKIDILNLNTLEVVGSITVEGWTERMITIGENTFVGNMSTGEVIVINNSLDVITNKIDVSLEPNSMAVGNDGLIYVLCSGGFQQEDPGIFVINPNTFQIEREIKGFTVDDYPTNLRMNAEKDSLFFLNANLFKMAIASNEIPQLPFIDLNSYGYAYGMEVLGERNEIYITDAVDFQNDGFVNRYDRSGKLLNSYTVGKAPRYMISF